MKPTVSMRLLGGFALEQNGTPISIGSPRLQALLAYLALRHGQPQPRRRLAFLLWPNSSEAQAQTNLRTVLHRAQATLPAVSQILHSDVQTIVWMPDQQIDLDVDTFAGALLAGAAAEDTGDDAAAVSAFGHGAALYIGDLLPDCYDDWVQPARQELRDGLLDALARVAALLERRRDYPAAIAHMRRHAFLEPLNEATYLTLMRLHALNNDRSGALRVYHACAATLQHELNTTPGTALHHAYEQLVAVALPFDERAVAGAIPLVGRHAAWRHIQATWQSVATGHSRLLLLTGEGGIGKTHMAEELLRWAARQGIITALAHCYPAEGALAYAPVVAWLRSDALQPALRRLSQPWLVEVGRLHPDLLADRQDLPAPGPLSEAWQRQRLFEALARALLAVQRPTMLLLDDLQWCDRDTLEWLHYLLRFTAGVPLLVVGTARTEELDEDHPLVALLAALRSEERLIEVPICPLDSNETAELAGWVAGHGLIADQYALVYSETEGNPLFIIEMVRASNAVIKRMIRGAQGQPAIGTMDTALPAGVRAVLTRRLQQVSPLAHDLLGVAAVIGRSFTFEVLAHAVEMCDDALVGGLDELWRRRIIREHGDDAYDFTHDKLRAVTYAALSLARRRLLHNRVAMAFEAAYVADLDAVSGQIAVHYEHAGKRDEAVAYARRAAEVAHRLCANHVAITHYQQAIRLLGRDNPAASSMLHNRVGDLLHLLGRYEDARLSWQCAEADAPIEQVIVLAHLQRKIGNAFRDEYRYADAGRVYDRAETTLAGIMDSSDERTACWADIQLERMTLDYWLGQIDVMLQRIEWVRPTLETIGDLSQRARLYQISAMAVQRRDRYCGSSEAIAYARAYLNAVTAIPNPQAIPAAHFQFGFALLWAGDHNEAEQHITQALGLAQHSGDVSLQGRCLTYLAIIARQQAAIERVRAYIEQGMAIMEVGQMYDYIGVAHGNRAWLAWRASDLPGVRAHAAAALAAWQKLPAGYGFVWPALWPLIGVALAEGDTATAVEYVCALLDERQQRPPRSLEITLEAVVHMARLGDSAAAHLHLTAASTLAHDFGFL